MHFGLLYSTLYTVCINFAPLGRSEIHTTFFRIKEKVVTITH